jgi:hypothetical protein
VQDLYLAAVHGEVEEFMDWLTPVYGSRSRPER